MRRLVILGPSDRSEVQRRLGDGYDAWLDELVAATLPTCPELIFMPDHGVYVDFALAFQRAGGKVTAIIPSDKPEFVAMATRYTPNYQTFPNATGWSYLNTHLVGLGTDILCIGYSAGSVLELASIKYVEKYDGKTLPLYIDRRAISVDLPLEFTRELSSVQYFETTAEYQALLEKGVS